MANQQIKSTQSGGIGIGMILFLIFMILKLTGSITWSWWIVTLPLWGPIGIVLFFGLIVFLISCLK
jgi:hypothetical protein